MKSAISVLAWKSQIQMSDLSRPRRLATFFLLAATAALAVLGARGFQQKLETFQPLGLRWLGLAIRADGPVVLRDVSVHERLYPRDPDADPLSPGRPPVRFVQNGRPRHRLPSNREDRFPAQPADEPLAGFEICGEDRVWKRASAEITGKHQGRVGRSLRHGSAWLVGKAQR